MPKPALSREKVLSTAIDYADKAGIEGLSMRKLADQLGVKAMSLYNHVANKDDLIDGMVERVVAQLRFEWRGQNWKTCMMWRANNTYRVLVRHPWATQALVSRVNAGPNMLHYVDDTLNCLSQAGFSIIDADHVWNAMDNYIYGFVLQELNFPFSPDEYQSVAKQYIDQVPAAQFPALHQLTQQVAAGRYDGRHPFEFGFQLLMDGLERQLNINGVGQPK